MIPNEIAGKYELRGTLGSGAMGTVYDAMDRMIERRVAIKLVKRPPPGDPEGEEAHGRFRREAQAAGRLGHANIVGVYDYGENAETAWIVMELVEGGSLKDRLDRQERFPVPEIIRVMDQILAALAYSHARGVVHRDIKPANIMLAGDGTVKIADFGIARLENSSMTQIGTVMGTPSYMAPEQLRGETVDARADIWAAGVMLYQLLTGEKPFEGGFSAVMHKALNTEPPPPSQLSVTAPRAFDAVVAKAMAKRPEDRYPNAAAFAEAIRGAASAESGFANAGPLPGLDAEATMVAGAALPPAKPPATGRPAAPAAGGRKAPVGLILGGAGAVVAAAAAAWFLLSPGGDSRQAEQQRLEQLRQQAERQAREAAERQRAAGTAEPKPQANVQEAAARTEQARQQAERARQEAEQRAQEEAVRAAEAEQARQAAEQRAREEASRAELSRSQAQTESARQQAEQRAREEAARAEQARLESERARRQAETARQQAEQRAREEAQHAEQARRAEEARQAQLSAEQRAREEAVRAEQARQEEARRAQTALAESQKRPAPDFRAAAAAAATAEPCSLIGWTASETGLTLTGIIRRGGEAAVRQALAARNVPPEAARLQLQSFEGPYCGALDILRPVLAGPEGAPRADILGSQPLAKGELLRLNVGMPAWPSQLQVSYLMQSGEVAHLVPSRQEAANAQIRLGEPRGSFTGWEVDEPFGTDMILVLTSDRPIFPQPRPVVEKVENYLPALTAALRAAQGQGVRVSVRALVLETVPGR